MTLAYTPTIANSYSWQYGDGAGDTAISPTHTYTAAGTYTISHTTTTDCFTETQKDTITIATTGLPDAMANALPIITVQDGSGNITFTLPAGQLYDNMEVYDANGKCIRSYTLGARPITDRFVPGFYIYHAYSADRMRTYHSKLMIH